jgi:prepilin-type N-terminal cleavage/methylation domain-containing protein
MTTPTPTSRPPRGLTLIEMSLVLFLIVALMSTGLFFSGAIANWQKGRNAAETLRLVYAAQRAYLADNPTVAVASITPDQLIPYLPNNVANMPTVISLTGAMLTIRVNVSPPIIDAGDGTPYDPSGSTKDSLWDIGQ